ncbi:MAG: SPOR domain-containing protein, partial [Comamonas sp.]
MALFKFRWPGQKEEREQTPMRRSRTAQAESVDDMRRRARHRLIGAAVLVVLGVIGFPILFDTQPRPIPVDVPIEIPDRNQVAPLIVPGAQAQTEPKGVVPASALPPIADGALGDGEELVVNEPAPLAVPKPPEPPRLVPEPVRTPVAVHKPEPKPDVLPEPKPVPAP